MRQTPEFQRIQELMQPGIISEEGFLGNDIRNLADILADDELKVIALDLTHEKIAEAMERLTEIGRASFGNPVMVDDLFRVTVESAKGKIASPFGGLYNKENIEVLNTRTDETIIWTTLNIHLIRDHGFYEGKGAFFRVEPSDLVRVLELG
ncbi:MAG TPA: hypothetical protein VFD57_02670 [Clostridia bacterium]|nr:hypothetical protein [Clostridia bacterium]